MTEAKLRKLENPAADPAELSDLINEAVGQHPMLQIDITDPPSPVIARAGELAVTASNADEATRVLGREFARGVRSAAQRRGGQ